MIFYFTGTGNSLWVAQKLSQLFSERLINISEEMKKDSLSYEYEMKENEKVFFVYPVHSWGPAVMVTQFIDRLKLSGNKNPLVFSISVCGDDCGYTNKIMKKALQRRQIPLTASYSVTMPNNYILLPGFDVDNKDIEERKLKEAPMRIEEIAESIRHKCYNVLYTKGGGAFWKTKLVYPLFVRFSLGKTSFYSTEKCIGCGICEKVCPTGTITMKDDRPKWGNKCVQCLACIHRCPVRAIEYGKATLNKGRYHNPDLK